MRIIIAVVVFFVVGLLILNPTYLVAYTEPSGMMALSVVIAMFGTSLVMLQRLGRFTISPRFIARPMSEVAP